MDRLPRELQQMILDYVTSTDDLKALCYSPFAKHIRCVRYNVLSVPRISEYEYEHGIWLLRQSYGWPYAFDDQYASYQEHKKYCF